MRKLFYFLHTRGVAKRANFRFLARCHKSNTNSQIWEMFLVRGKTQLATLELSSRFSLRILEVTRRLEKSLYERRNNVAILPDESDARKCGLVASRAEIVSADLPDLLDTRERRKIKYSAEFRRPFSFAALHSSPPPLPVSNVVVWNDSFTSSTSSASRHFLSPPLARKQEHRI